MSQTVCVVVGDIDRKRLVSIVADRNRPQKHIQRARIVLLSDEGLAVAEVARQAGVSRPAVWRWQARYAEAGVEALLRDKTRPPGTAKLATATVATISQSVGKGSSHSYRCEKPTYGREQHGCRGDVDELY